MIFVGQVFYPIQVTVVQSRPVFLVYLPGFQSTLLRPLLEPLSRNGFSVQSNASQVTLRRGSPITQMSGLVSSVTFPWSNPVGQASSPIFLVVARALIASLVVCRWSGSFLSVVMVAESTVMRGFKRRSAK